MAWKFKLVVLESLDQDSKPIEAINRKAKKPEQNDTTWVDGQEFSWKRFPKWPRKASSVHLLLLFALLQYFVPEKMDYALYCIHYIQEIVNPQGGKKTTKEKCTMLEFAWSKNIVLKRSLNWLFSWSTDTLQSQNFIFFKKSQNFRCQRSIRGKVESSRKSSMEKRKWQKFLWHYEIKFLDPSPAQTLSILLFTSAFERAAFCLFITLKGRIILAISYFVFILIE